MSLLVDIAANALEPGYAAAAARRGGDTAGTPAAGRGRVLVAAFGVLAASLLIVVAGVQAQRQVPAASKARQALVAQVRSREASLNALQARLSRLRAHTQQLRTATLASTAAGERLAARLTTAELAAGTEPVQGPGLRITLDDAPVRPDGTQNRVLDTDLQSVVNALWAAGAEAVAIGGERLTAQSAIRSAGGALLVNFVPQNPPYVVEAIGDPVSMETGLATSPAATRMRAAAQLYGLGFHYAREGTLALPAANGVALRYARPIPTGGGAAQ